METSQACPSSIRDALQAARAHLGADAAAGKLEPALEAGAIIGALTANQELALALLARAAVRAQLVATEDLAGVVGAPAAQIATALVRLGSLGLPRDWSPADGLDTPQTETLRKMLLAVVSDPRLVLARLAEELVALRHARGLTAAERGRRALEARAV
ncbi:MAG TPA: HD domain-containing protein, partial [Steroidobacteraceae bacterium]